MLNLEQSYLHKKRFCDNLCKRVSAHIQLIFCLVQPSAGGAFPFTVGRVEHGYNVRPDLCATNCKISPRKFLGKFYTDALVHDPKALDLLVDVIGEVRTCKFDTCRQAF